MLKYRSKIKKQNAQTLGAGFVVEHKVYVPRGQVNTSFFNVYKISGETSQYYLVEPIPLVEMQIVRNHLAKQRGEDEWSFDFLYNADQSKAWIAFGITDPDNFLRENTKLFVNIIKNREEDYKQKMENRKKLMAKRNEIKKMASSETLSLSGKDWNLLKQMDSNPPEPNQKLKKLFAKTS